MSKKCLGDILLTFFCHFAKTQLDPSWSPGHFFDIFLTFCQRAPATPRNHPPDIFGTFFGESRKPSLQRTRTSQPLNSGGGWGCAFSWFSGCSLAFATMRFQYLGVENRHSAHEEWTRGASKRNSFEGGGPRIAPCACLK